MDFFTQSQPPGSLLKGEYSTTYREDFGAPHSSKPQAGLGRRKPLLRNFQEKRDIALHVYKEKKVMSLYPVLDRRRPSPCPVPVQKRGVPPRPIQVRKVAQLPVKEKGAPLPFVGKVAPTRPGQKVVPPHHIPEAVPPQPIQEERVSTSHPVRKVAPAHPLQKVVPPHHVLKVLPPQLVQERRVTLPHPLRKLTPPSPSMEEMAAKIQLHLENESAQIQFNLEEKSAQIQLDLEEKAAYIQFNLGKKEAEIQSNLEKVTTQIQLNLEQKEAEIQCSLENTAAKIQLKLEEKAARIQLNLERKEAEIQLNLEAMVAQIQVNMEEKAAQTQFHLDSKEAQIQLHLEELAAHIQFNLQQMAAHIQYNIEEKAAQIQFKPEENTTQILGETASEIQCDLALNATPTHREMGEEVQRVSGLSPESFVFHKVLGKGAFGKVMLAELKESGRYFAVKSLKKDSILTNCHVECTKVEKRVLALAAENPFLTHLHSTFQTKDSLFYVMEYVSGRDLYFHIVLKGYFDLHSTQFYTAEMICGLQFLHRNGVIYRDLKLNNVMLDEEGHIKIVDFGLCKDNLLDGKAMSFCGTEHYIAPEIFQGKEYSFPVDWWSLGVLVFEMLTGDSPFHGENDNELSMSVCTDTPEYPTWINQESKDLLEKLLERDPTHRLGVAGDIRSHPFFDTIDWPALERKEVEPPFKPKMGDHDDGSQLYLEILSKASHLTDSGSGSVHPDDQLAFAGFSFINPKWSS